MSLTYFYYETPKSGIDDYRNEDSIYIRPIAKNSLLILLSDGASTGVFSKEWSDHITHNFDLSWLKSPEEFEFGIESIRASFKPQVDRPTALRKFLMEGSYATLLATLIEERNWLFSRQLKLILYAIGDVCALVVNPSKNLIFSHPYKSSKDFNNVPNLIRSTKVLQQKSPYEIKSTEIWVPADSLIVLASDAIGEFLLKKFEIGKGFKHLVEIKKCENNDQFREKMDIFRYELGMKNDDVTLLFLSKHFERYFPEKTVDDTVNIASEGTL